MYWSEIYRSIYDEAGTVIETHKPAGDFKD